MFKRVVRKDGSVVLIVPKPDSKSVTWDVAYKVGSRQEQSSINGVSHFIEHLMFKGTTRRPTTQELSRELDSVGAEYNAFTSKDNTQYYIETDVDHKTLGIDMLSDMLHHSKFERTEMERERGVIVEELNMYRDNPMMRIEELFESVIFNGHTLGMDIGGPRSVIKTVPYEHLLAYKNKYYYSGNSVIGIAGKITSAEALKMVNRYFPVRTKKPRATFAKVTIKQDRPRIKVEFKETDQIQVMVGFPGLKRTHPSFDALSLLSIIMGGTMSSRLFIQIRERKGLAYVVRSSAEAYEDTGYFSVHAGLDKKRLNEAITAIREELDKVAEKGVTDEELKRAKDNLRGRLTLRFERPSSYLSFLIGQELFTDSVVSLEQRLARVDAVTKKDVHTIAQQVIDWKKSNLALIGPFKDAKQFRALITK